MSARPSFLLTAVAALVFSIAAHAQPIEVNGIAAKVNGKVITKNEVSFLLSPTYAQLAAQFPRRGPEFERRLKEARDGILKELIDREIILDEFKLIGGAIKPQFIDQEIKRQMRELYNGDENKFRAELKKSRLTMEGFREMTRKKLIVQAMRAEQFADAPPPLPGEIRAEYEKIKGSMRDITKDVISFKKIFIPIVDQQNPIATPETQLALAEDVLRQLKEGKDFAALAKEFSRDAFSDQGGIQQNVPRIDLSPEFAAIIFDAKVGELVGPLQDPQGFTIVIPITIVPGPSQPLSDPQVKKFVEERVSRNKTSAQYERWIEARRARAMIDIRN
jgi:peptidyl-prolyl cis-trans isomerase SurA